MRMRTIEISVGAFMLAGLLALGFLAIQVSGLSIHDSNRDTYKLYAHFTNASGLAARAKISVAGVVIGRVTAITLDPKDTRAKVEMAIQKNVNFLTNDSIASIQTAGILGEKYISISVGGDPEVLKEGDEITDTQSALVLEDLIGKVLTSIGSKKD
ncbi:MAG TPA: outer membrane lipid asymmetry maintenance protein MlaD [Spongiibacteraceae bacterium]